MRAANPKSRRFSLRRPADGGQGIRHRQPRGSLPAAYSAVIACLKTPEYVSAPVVVAERVVGFIALDACFSSRRLAQDDVERGTAMAALLSGALTQQALVGALRKVDAAAERLLGGMSDLCRTETPSRRTRLSTREAEAIELVAQRLTNSEIAEALGISPATVRRTCRGRCAGLTPALGPRSLPSPARRINPTRPASGQAVLYGSWKTVIGSPKRSSMRSSSPFSCQPAWGPVRIAIMR